MNEQIRITPIRLIGAEGEQLSAAGKLSCGAYRRTKAAS
jgi:hypothetical protein